MNWILSLLGKDKLILEIVELVRDLLVEEHNNKTWTKITEVTPPEKKMLVFRDSKGYYVGYCQNEGNRIRVGKYGKFEVAIIPEPMFERCYWMEIGDPIGLYTDPDNIGDVSDKAQEDHRDREDGGQ